MTDGDAVLLLWFVVAIIASFAIGGALCYRLGYGDGRRDRAYEEWRDRLTPRSMPTTKWPADDEGE